MNKYILNFCLLVLFILALSCSFSKDDKVNYFSINNPFTPEKNNQIDNKIVIRVLPIGTGGPYGSKMVFMKSPNSVYFDDYNCWAQEPTEMLTNYFTLYFAQRIGNKEESSLKKFFLKGTILTFDCNLDNKTANLNIDFELNENSGKVLFSKIYSNSIKMKKLSASDFAASMSEAIKLTAEELTSDINKKIK